jgi:threonine synthase
MKFVSTRLSSPSLSFSEVILQGLAPDGGLYVPEFLPLFDGKKLSEMAKMTYQELFFEVTYNFVAQNISEDVYKKIIAKSYQNFNHQAIAPLKQISHNHYLLELFHGPTLAFKDFALQFLGNLLDYLLSLKKEKIVIVGATSGDTGSAAIHGCKMCQNATIFILHPYQKVSPVQRRQMTTVIADNVFNIALQGNFDDCQNFVKKMFVNQQFLNGRRMVAVNSINFARIMAQIVYYFYSGLRVANNNGVSFSVPTGNFGDIYAGYLAKKMGLNIKKLIVATNTNNILVRFLHNKDYSKQPMIETISPSMNIQVASNFERLIFDVAKSRKLENSIGVAMQEFERTNTLTLNEEIHKAISQDFIGFNISDEATILSIQQAYIQTSEVLDPHTAIGFESSLQFINSKHYTQEPIVTLATAHPAKFPDAIVQAKMPEPKLPHFLQNLFEMPEKYDILENSLEAVKQFIASK